MTYPNLAGIAQPEDIQTKGKGSFAASYINWARIAHYLRKHAPGWQPYASSDDDGNIQHAAPDGSFYLMIGFVGPDGERTELVPHAVMDHKMQAKKNPDARDIADAFVRGMCKAAALHFGLAWELWSKDDPLGRTEDEEFNPMTMDDPKLAAKVDGLKTSAKKKAKEEPAVEPYEQLGEAKGAIENTRTVAELREVGIRIRGSAFTGGDRDELLLSYTKQMAALEEQK